MEFSFHFYGFILLGFCFIFMGLNGNSAAEEVAEDAEKPIGESQINVIVQIGEAVEFSCPILNSDGHEMFWHHESQSGTKFTISSSSDANIPAERVRLAQDYTLQLFPVIEEDSGYYACTVGNGWSQRILYYLHVIGPPSIVIEPESGSITAVEGDPLQIGCRPRGNPSPRVTWRKQYGAIPDSSNTVTINGNFLSFSSTSPSDSGTYICKAQNGIGSSAYGRIHVQILYPPDLKIPNGVIFGGAGYSATLKCLVQAEPPAQVRWFFEKKVVPDSKRLISVSSGAENALHISNVRDSDFGFYMCMANNSVGFGLGYVELSGASSPPVVTRWETSPCDKNNDRKIRSKKNKKRKGCDCKWRRRRIPRNVTCKVHVRLNWAVESYNPVIDYRLMFRRVKRNPNSDVRTWPTNEDEEVMSWTELSIPADPGTGGPIHTKGYRLHGLPSGHHYEAALTARNKWGVSQLSTIFYFSTFPRTSHKAVDIDELFPDASRRRSTEDGGLEDKGDGEEEIYHQLGHSRASSRTTSVFRNYLTTTTLQLTPTLPALCLLLLYRLIF